MTVKNLIFLDLDEVLCTDGSRFAYDKITALDPMCCMLLLKLCKKTQSQIIVHSSWRLYANGFDLFLAELDEKCPELKDYVIETTGNAIYDKADSIDFWLKDNSLIQEVYDYIIIDDIELDFSNHKYLSEHFHKIRVPERGLGLLDYMDIIRYFKTERKEIE